MVAALVLTLLAADASSEEARPTFIRWSAPSDCPSEAAFTKALEFRTPRVRRVRVGEEPTAWLDAEVTHQGPRFVGKVSVRLPSGALQRSVKSPKCETVLAALSLAAALLIDPEHAKLGPLPPEVLAPTPPPEPAPPPPEPTTPPAEPAPATPPTPAEPPEPRPTPPPPSVVAPPPRPAEQPSAPVSVRLGAGAHLTTAISTLVDVGGHAAVSVDVRRFVARLSLGGGSGSTVTSATAGRARYAFHLLASLEAGVHGLVGPVRLEGLLAVGTLVFNVTSVDAAQPAAVWRWLLPVGPVLRAGVDFFGWNVSAGLQVGLNVRRDTYVVDPDGGVFTTPLVYVQPTLGISRRL